VQGVELVFVASLLGADSLCPLQPQVQVAVRLWIVCGEANGCHLALHLTDDDAQDSALAFEHTLQATELFGMGVAPCFPAQGFAFFGKGLLELDACAFGGTDNLVAGDLQQAAVYRVGNGFFLDRRVDNHALQVLGFDCFDAHCGVDGGFEQQLQAIFAQGFSEAPDLGGITG